MVRCSYRATLHDQGRHIEGISRQPREHECRCIVFVWATSFVSSAGILRLLFLAVGEGTSPSLESQQLTSGTGLGLEHCGGLAFAIAFLHDTR